MNLGHKSLHMEYSSLFDNLVSGDFDVEDADGNFVDWISVVKNDFFAPNLTIFSFNLAEFVSSILLCTMSLTIVLIHASIVAVRLLSILYCKFCVCDGAAFVSSFYLIFFTNIFISF